jgi:predicted PurR-regulated permease PerM
MGGTLGGILGALVAIPTSASILLVIREVWMPRQQLK